jgi:hypothetical protein
VHQGGWRAICLPVRALPPLKCENSGIVLRVRRRLCARIWVGMCRVSRQACAVEQPRGWLWSGAAAPLRLPIATPDGQVRGVVTVGSRRVVRRFRRGATGRRARRGWRSAGGSGPYLSTGRVGSKRNFLLDRRVCPRFAAYAVSSDVWHVPHWGVRAQKRRVVARGASYRIFPAAGARS